MVFCNPANEMKQIHGFGLISVTKWHGVEGTACVLHSYLELPLQAQDLGSSHLCFSYQQHSELKRWQPDSSPGGYHTGGLKAVLGKGACFPGLRLLGQAAAASHSLTLTVPKCWSSLCRADEDFLSRGHLLDVPEG